MTSIDSIKKQVNHCTIAVRDWLAGGCDVNDIPRPEMAVLVAFQKEWLKDMEQSAQQHAGDTDALVDAYCKAWAQSFAAANPHHTVKMTAEDRQHIVAGLKAALAAQPQGCDTPNYCSSVQRCTANDTKRAQPQLAPILPNSLPAFKQYLQECEDCLINPDVAGAFNAGWQAMQKAAVRDMPHGWVVNWPSPSGGTRPIYRASGIKPKYGEGLDDKLTMYPVFTRTAPTAPVQQAPAKRQYYYQVTGCTAEDSKSKDCICWHDEGTGPRANEPEFIRSWRAKP